MIADAEVNEGRGDEMFLKEEAGADFDCSGDAEGVDALIAFGGGGSQLNVLPVVVFRAVGDLEDGLSTGGRDANEIEFAVAVRIDRGGGGKAGCEGKRREILDAAEEDLRVAGD